MLLLISLFGALPAIIAYASFFFSQSHKEISGRFITGKNPASYGFIVLIVCAVLLASNLYSNMLAIQPGENKGLRYLLGNPSGYNDVSTNWNSFSRIDIVKHTGDISKTGFRDLASILIDADALTPILKWNGSLSDRQWLKAYMDYMPYEISNMNDSRTLVIGKRRWRGYSSRLVGRLKECDSSGIESVDSIRSKTIWWEFSRKFV